MCMMCASVLYVTLAAGMMQSVQCSVSGCDTDCSGINVFPG